jgi:hypothetical protein
MDNERIIVSHGPPPDILVLKAKQESKASFLKKRSKKLLSVARSLRVKWEISMLPETDRSFLVLFFKKELLSYLPAAKASN